MGQIYIQGILLGFAYVAPIGMQNIFIINRALTADLRRALTAAVSVTFFDILLSSACFFGVGNVLYLYPQAGHIILGAGSCFIIFIFSINFNISFLNSSILIITYRKGKR